MTARVRNVLLSLLLAVAIRHQPEHVSDGFSASGAQIYGVGRDGNRLANKHSIIFGPISDHHVQKLPYQCQTICVFVFIFSSVHISNTSLNFFSNTVSSTVLETVFVFILRGKNGGK